MNANASLRLRRLSRPLRRLAHALGLIGGAGLVLLAIGVSALLLQTVTPPMDTGRRQPLPSAPAPASAPAEAGPSAPAAPVTSSPLTPEHETHQAVLRLFEAARDNRLELLEGDYRLSATADPRYRIYSISLPLKGSYPAVRAFLATCLRHDPRLALDALEFRREQIAEEVLEARVKLSLFLGPP